MVVYDAQGTETGRYFYHFDGLGSVVALSNNSGSIVEGYMYDAFGKCTVVTSAGTDGNWLTDDGTSDAKSAYGNPYQFTARRWDDETDLYYYRARMYKPEIGRFLQPDPIGYDDGMNMYAYVGNNPVNLVDPMGLCKSNLSRWDQLKSSALTSLIGGIDSWHKQSGGKEMEQFLWKGGHVGTQYGKSSMDWYAKRYVDSGKWSFRNFHKKIAYGTGGLASAAWTPKTWKKTTVTLTAAAVVAGPASKTKPWLGKAGMHTPHHGMGKHFEIIIRVGGGKNFKIIIPGIKKLIYFGIQ